MKRKILTMITIGSILLMALIVCKKSSGKRTRSARAMKAGLYQSDGSFIPWDNLGIDVEADYSDKNRETEAKNPCQVFREKSYNGKLVLPDNIKSIGDVAFFGCTDLKSIDLPDSITSIGDWAFGDCKSLVNIDYAGTMEKWNAVDKGLEWNGDSGLETITCSDGVITL